MFLRHVTRRIGIYIYAYRTSTMYGQPIESAPYRVEKLIGDEFFFHSYYHRVKIYPASKSHIMLYIYIVETVIFVRPNTSNAQLGIEVLWDRGTRVTAVLAQNRGRLRHQWRLVEAHGRWGANILPLTYYYPVLSPQLVLFLIPKMCLNSLR